MAITNFTVNYITLEWQSNVILYINLSILLVNISTVIHHKQVKIGILVQKVLYWAEFYFAFNLGDNLQM